MSLVVKCPRCNKIATSQPDGVLEYFDPEFKCKTRGCLYVGRLHASMDNRISETAIEGKVPFRKVKNVIVTSSIAPLQKTRKPRSDAGKKRGAYGPRK